MKNITKILIAITLIFSMNNCKKDPVNNTTTNTTKINKDSIKRANIEKFVYNDTSMDNILFIDTTRFYGSFSSITWDTVFQDLPDRKDYHRYVIREVPNSHPEYNKDEPTGVFLDRHITFGWRGKDYNNNWGYGRSYDTFMAISIKDKALIATAPSYGDAYHLLKSRITQDSFLQFVEERIKNQPAELGNYRLFQGQIQYPSIYLSNFKFIDPQVYKYAWDSERLGYIPAYFEVNAGNYEWGTYRDSELPVTSRALVDDMNCFCNIKNVKLSDGNYHTVGYFKIYYKNIFFTDDRSIKPITGKILMD